jgi:hypothetical protein
LHAWERLYWDSAQAPMRPIAAVGRGAQGGIVGVSSWAKAILIGLVGIVIAVVVTALVNLLFPVGNIVVTLVVAGIPAFISAFLGFLVGAGQKKGTKGEAKAN